MQTHRHRSKVVRSHKARTQPYNVTHTTHIVTYKQKYVLNGSYLMVDRPTYVCFHNKYVTTIFYIILYVLTYSIDPIDFLVNIQFYKMRLYARTCMWVLMYTYILKSRFLKPFKKWLKKRLKVFTNCSILNVKKWYNISTSWQYWFNASMYYALTNGDFSFIIAL